MLVQYSTSCIYEAGAGRYEIEIKNENVILVSVNVFVALSKSPKISAGCSRSDSCC